MCTSEYRAIQLVYSTYTVAVHACILLRPMACRVKKSELLFMCDMSVMSTHVPCCSTVYHNLPYSRKIWRELNLAKSPKTAKIKYWRNLNLAIVYGEGYDVIT